MLLLPLLLVGAMDTEDDAAANVAKMAPTGAPRQSMHEKMIDPIVEL